ncbi:MAG TPA: hypothetical protein VMW50_13505 [Dehalococcoidia bacterium]|nr:hypothetical protein [Dehalococcoidia bacterium]
MTEDIFNELELLSQEDLIVETLRMLLKAYAEVGRREEVTKDFLKSICGFSLEGWVWWTLLESGIGQRFTDIHKAVGCSPTSLTDVLGELLRVGHIRMVGKRYQAVVPATWLLHFSGVNRRKP